MRLSHYPQSESFLDACDELGLIVMDCLPGWQFMGDSTFQVNVKQNLRDMVRRDRNRTCILFWENSLNETWMEPIFTKELNTTLVYRATIKRPGIGELNPNIEYGDPYNIRFGNPYLEPTLSHNYDWNVSYVKGKY